MSGEVEEVEGQSAEAPAPQMLQLFVSRIERLSDEIADLQADRKDVFAEAKANGFDQKALREVLRRRKMEPHHLAELDTLVAIYEEAVRGVPRGMIWGGELTPQQQPRLAPPKPPSRRETAALAALAAAEAAQRASSA
jgi:uncharacterized protein (UPF0335 family)